MPIRFKRADWLTGSASPRQSTCPWRPRAKGRRWSSPLQARSDVLAIGRGFRRGAADPAVQSARCRRRRSGPVNERETMCRRPWQSGPARPVSDVSSTARRARGCCAGEGMREYCRGLTARSFEVCPRAFSPTRGLGIRRILSVSGQDIPFCFVNHAWSWPAAGLPAANGTRGARMQSRRCNSGACARKPVQCCLIPR